MQEISLENSSYQEMQFSHSGCIFEITLRSFGNDESDMILFATVTVNGERAAVSQRCVPNGWLIPQPYLTKGYGNFRFECDDDNYPYYENFGSTCRLVYYTDAEYRSEMG